MYKVSLIDKISIILVIIGALNWGIFGLFGINLVAEIFNLVASRELSQILQNIIYILVGLSGLNIIFLIVKSRSLRMHN